MQHKETAAGWQHVFQGDFHRLFNSGPFPVHGDAVSDDDQLPDAFQLALPGHMPQHLRIKRFGCLLLRADSAFFDNQGINPQAGEMVLKDAENPPPDVPVVFCAVKKDEIQPIFNQVKFIAAKGFKGGERPPGGDACQDEIFCPGRGEVQIASFIQENVQTLPEPLGPTTAEKFL